MEAALVLETNCIIQAWAKGGKPGPGCCCASCWSWLCTGTHVVSIWRMASSGLTCLPSVPAPQGCRSPHFSCAASHDLFPTGLLHHSCFKVNTAQIELPTSSHTPSSPIYAATHLNSQKIAHTTPALAHLSCCSQSRMLGFEDADRKKHTSVILQQHGNEWSLSLG